ncbi:hypothetical protein RCL_jg16801.t1 [Rhizophagus clarus]|uniref:Uncharacterized protein n=1 Tax=Rhizophagus clarus TaxID=94130 RepID=A0A8H3LGG0_9GLOM|nr:hypothetical protein RCL_jg16801.t1 [Rhizophagus clarus]
MFHKTSKCYKDTELLMKCNTVNSGQFHGTVSQSMRKRLKARETLYSLILIGLFVRSVEVIKITEIKLKSFILMMKYFCGFLIEEDEESITLESINRI